MHAVFGYGSLCDLSTLRSNEKIYRPLKNTMNIGILYKYKIRLNKSAWTGKYSYCNIEYTGDDSDYVYGIILYLTQKELEAVNRREGYISDNNPENSYHRHVRTVVTPTGNEDVFVYIANPVQTSKADLEITPDYARHIITGLKFLETHLFFKDRDYFTKMERYYRDLIATVCHLV